MYVCDAYFLQKRNTYYWYKYGINKPCDVIKLLNYYYYDKLIQSIMGKLRNGTEKDV